MAAAALTLSVGDAHQHMPEPGLEDIQSIDSLFLLDDDEESDGRERTSLYSDDSFTILEGPMSPPPPEEPVRNHLRRSSNSKPAKTSDKVKTKLVGFLHKVQYGWRVKSESKFNKKKPIFLLSKCYDCRLAYEEGGDVEVKHTVLRFKQDFTSRIWMTYREGFPRISDSLLTSDSGWGCMLRAGQMILAQALVTHFLDRDWDMFTDTTSYSTAMHKEIIRWFGDRPSPHSPFSLHRLVAIAKSINRKPGDWYGPSCVAGLLAKACEIASDFVPILRDICVYVGYDHAIYKQDVIDLATGATDNQVSHASPPPSTDWKAVVILIPLGLGFEKVCPSLIPCLKGLFVLDNFLGIIGGTPKHALYFIGFQGNDIIHLDPHLMQDTVDVSGQDFPTHTYHCVYPKKTAFTNMDCSCALGFYCRTRQDFDRLKDTVKPFLIPTGGRREHPIFDVYDGSRMDQFARPEES